MSDNTWDQESSLAFMEGYKNEEILWNNKHPLHKDREKMNEAWERLSEEFGKPVAELKKKKDNMLTIYNRNKRQECKTQNFISNWFAFKVMNSFLGERRAQKESASAKHRISPIIEKSYVSESEDYIEMPKMSIKRNYQPEFELVPTSVEPEVVNHEKKLDEFDMYGNIWAIKLRRLSLRGRREAIRKIVSIFDEIEAEEEDNRLYS